jgi:2-polyprenyl-3-methyl-5-hydroxy-6-metoxy-1,4-benzoquinol methylase
MNDFNRKKHWENIYQTKILNEVSWYQPLPQTSLDFVAKFNLTLDAKIIDVGGGDSFFVDHLLKLGFQNITVLDISEVAISRAKERLGSDSERVKWIVSDITEFVPEETYDFWHDRAVFHFLRSNEDQQAYVNVLNSAMESNGVLIIGTFSESGPLKCSGIEIQQYSELSLEQRFNEKFQKVECFTIDHPTPFDTIQNFVFCSFRKV